MRIVSKRIGAKYVTALAICAIQLNAFSQVIKENILINEPYVSILQSSDSELIYVGTKQNSTRNENDVTLTKKDLDGEIVWQKSIEMDYNCSVRDAAVLSDNSIVVVGGASRSTFQSIPFVLKTDPNGNKLWTKYFNAGLQAEKVIENYDGGYLIAYYSEGSYLMKLNNKGDSIWSQKVSNGRPHGLTETSEAVYLVVDDQNNDIVLSSIGSRGEVLWKLDFGGPGIDQPVAVLNDRAVGDNYIIAGTYSSDGSGDDFYIALIDCFGYVRWTKTFGGPGMDLCYNLMQASDGEFIAVGASNSYSKNGKFDFFAIKIDSNGKTVWEKTFPGKENLDYHATNIFETSYGSFLIAGSELPDKRNATEAYLVEIVNPTQLNISIDSDKQTFTSPPYKVQFTNHTPFAEYLDFVWDFGDGVTLQSNDNTVIHEYEEDGLYDVKLIASAIDFGSIDSVVFENYINCSVDISTLNNNNLIQLSQPKIQPNPFYNRTTISFHNPDNDVFSLRIRDQNGKLIQEVQNIRGSSVELDRNNLPAGIHFVELSGTSTSVAKILIE